MPIAAALLIGGLGIAGSAISSSNQADASKQAADEQYKAAQLAANTQLHMYDTTRSDLAPFLQTGQGALSQLSSLFGLPGAGGAPGSGTGPTAGTAAAATSALSKYPGYQFQYGQGLQALDRSAASRGLLQSGAEMKDAQVFGQGLASNQWQNYLSSLTGLAGLGENAGAQVGNAGTQTGAGVAASQLAGGQAQAAGTVGAANATTSGLQGALNSALTGYQLYQNNNNPGFSPTFTSPLTTNLTGGNYNSGTGAFSPLALTG